MAPLLADPRVSQFSLLTIEEPFHNSFNNSIHNPSYTSFHLFHPCVENSRVCFFINQSVNPSSWSGHFPSPDYGYLRLKRPVPRARDIMIHNIYRPQGTSSFISSFSHDSDFSDFFSAAPDNSDVFSHLHHALLDILLTIFYLEILTYTTPCGEELKPMLTQWLRILFPFAMLISYIFCFPRGLSRVQKVAVRPLLIWFLHPHS